MKCSQCGKPAVAIVATKMAGAVVFEYVGVCEKHQIEARKILKEEEDGK